MAYTDYATHAAPNHQHFSVLHVIFRRDALSKFIDVGVTSGSEAKDAFTEMKHHFITPANKYAYTAEWNTLSFEDMRQKRPG